MTNSLESSIYSCASCLNSDSVGYDVSYHVSMWGDQSVLDSDNFGAFLHLNLVL